MSKVLGLKFAESTVEITALFAGHHFCIEAQMRRGRWSLASPQTAARILRRPKILKIETKKCLFPNEESSFPHDKTFREARKNCNSIRICPKRTQHPPPPQKCI